MLTINNTPSAAKMSLPEDETDRFVDLQSVIDAEELNTHALLLLYLMPVANCSGVDSNTAKAVEVLSDVQSRLSTPSGDEPFSRDALAMVYSRLAAIRFGT